MSIIKCKDCKKEISSSAQSCPSCGAPIAKLREAKIQAVALMLVIGAGLYWWYAPDTKTSTVASTTAVVSEKSAPTVPAPVICAKDDLQCLAGKGVISASASCKRKIEKLFINSTKWTNSMFVPIFMQMRWLDKEKGQITYVGDSLQAQNNYGAFINQLYECDVDADGKTVINVSAESGRLN